MVAVGYRGRHKRAESEETENSFSRNSTHDASNRGSLSSPDGSEPVSRSFRARKKNSEDEELEAIVRSGRRMQEISEETSLIVAAVFAVVTLFVTRTTWFPAATVQSWVTKPQCQLSVALNSKGVVEGPWLNDTWQQEPPSVKGFLSGATLLQQGKLVAVTPGGDDGVLKPEHLALGIESFQETGGTVITLAFARLAERYLAPWVSIEGIQEGLGKRGVVKAISLKSMATNKKLAPCIANVRVLEGHVYFRYGAFLECPRKLKRINLMIRAIQEAVTKFNLAALKVEFYINACDDPQSYDNSFSHLKSGFAMFSTKWTPGSTDILCPDPLDLLRVAETAVPPSNPWEQREAKAVWRGEGSEFQWGLKTTNWASSFRVRLHRMTDARPDLLDARLSAWGPKDAPEAKELLIKNGIILGEPMSLQQRIDVFKYSMVVDEAVGTNEMCGALASPQAVIRHASGLSQFFDPLLIPGVHYMPVRHTFADLFETVEWMRSNDDSVKQMVKNANEIAAFICSQDAQVHFWAVLLSKYSSRAMEEPEAVKKPTVCSGGKAITSAPWAKEKSPPTCKHPSNQPCTDFCAEGKKEEEWTWLDSSAVQDLTEILAAPQPA